MTTHTSLTPVALAALCLLASGCVGHKHGHKTYGGPPYGPPHDRPFPVGQVTDAHWETQQTNAEAADFIFYDHEFRYDATGNHVDTAQLSPLAKKHLEASRTAAGTRAVSRRDRAVPARP